MGLIQATVILKAGGSVVVKKRTLYQVPKSVNKYAKQLTHCFINVKLFT